MIDSNRNKLSEWRIGTITYVDQRQIKFRAVASDITDRLLWGKFRHINSLNQYLFAYLNTAVKVIFKVIAIEEYEKPYGHEASNRFLDSYVFSAIPLGAISSAGYSPGVVDIPMVGSDIYACDETELAVLFECGELHSVGQLAGYRNIRPSLELDDLFGGHTAVLGNTGSGKSTTVRLLLSELMGELVDGQHRIKDDALFVVFDLHGDYKKIAKKFESIDATKVTYYDNTSYRLSPGKLTIDDWSSILNPSQRIQKPILERTIRYAALNEKGMKKLYAALAYQALEDTNADSHASRRILISKYVDKLDKDINYPDKQGKLQTEFTLNLPGKHQPTTCTPQSLKELFSLYNLYYGNLPDGLQNTLQTCFSDYLTHKYMNGSQPDINKVLNNKKQFSKERSAISMDDIDRSLDFVFAEEEVRGNKQARSYSEGLVTQLYNLREKYSSNILSNSGRTTVSSILEHKTGCVIFDVSEMPDSDGLKLFSNYVARYLFERNRQDDDYDEEPVYLIFDEAHRYIRQNDLTDDSIFNQIAREGRKFGVHLTIISQIPSELSKVVLSQTGAFIIHRIQNAIDLDYIKRNVPSITADQVSRLPSFAPGTAVVLGSAFQVPMELEIDGIYKDETPGVSMYKS